MKIKVVPTNNVTIEVTPRRAGNFGIVRFSGHERTPEAEYRLAKEIENNIKRHVDDIEYTQINQVRLYQDEYGDEYETLYDLLEDHFNEFRTKYVYRYERPSDNGVVTQGYTYDFRFLIETAFNNPHNFQVLEGELTEHELQFLNKVLVAAVESKVEWVR